MIFLNSALYFIKHVLLAQKMNIEFWFLYSQRGYVLKTLQKINKTVLWTIEFENEKTKMAKIYYEQ